VWTADVINLLKAVTDILINALGRKRTDAALKESEEKYRSAINQSSDCIFLVDYETKCVLETNPAMASLLGYSKEEITGMSIYDFIAHDRKSLDQDIQRSTNEGSLRAERQWRKKDGNLVDVEINVNPLNHGGKKVLTNVARDSSQRKAMERALQEERDRAQHYLNVAGALIIVIDVNQTVRLINRRGLEILGYKEDEIIGKNWFETFVPETNRQQTKSDFEKLLAGEVGMVEHYEHPILTKRGKERIISWQNSTLSDEEGRITATLNSGTDITDRIRGEQELRESENKYRTLFESSRNAIVLTNQEGKYTDVNQAALVLFGYTRDEMLAMNAKDTYLNPEDREELLRILEQKGYVKDYELRFKKRCGPLMICLTTATRRCDGDGNAIGVQEIIHDITDRKEVEEALRESEQRYRTLTHNIPGMVYRARPDWSTELVSGCEDVCGYSDEELISQKINWVDIIHPDDKERVLKEDLKLSKHHRPVALEYRILDKGGSIRWVEDAKTASFSEDGAFQRVDGVVMDITGRKRAEEQQEKLEAQLRQAQKMETLGVLVAGIAHEINNPVNSLTLGTPLLRNIWLDLMPVLEEYARRNPTKRYGGLTHDFLREKLGALISGIDGSAQRIGRIVQSLRNFAKQSEIGDKEPFSMNDAIRSAVSLSNTTVKQGGILLRLYLEESLPLIEGDRQSIEQVMINLILNAVQAIEHEEGRITIASKFLKKRQRIEVEIRDNGKGIDNSFSDRIFDPFFTTRQAEGGSGLGLAVTYSLVKAHGGDITFESEKGNGTRFIVSLPQRMQKEKVATVLVADDDDTIRDILKNTLTSDRPYLVKEACNGTDACIKIGTLRPDIVILDIIMPGMDGVKVCRAIKENPELEGTRILAMTGFLDDPKVDEIKKIGIDHLYYKPFKPQDILQAVDEMLK